MGREKVAARTHRPPVGQHMTLASFYSPSPQSADLKRRKRLEKNRESARECRRRKKENKERLEAKLQELEVSEHQHDDLELME